MDLDKLTRLLATLREHNVAEFADGNLAIKFAPEQPIDLPFTIDTTGMTIEPERNDPEDR